MGSIAGRKTAAVGGGGNWHQKWRRPLRDSLDWLRDQLSKVFEESGKKLFRDPWEARNAYIQVILDRSPTQINRVLVRHQSHKLNASRADRCLAAVGKCSGTRC